MARSKRDYLILLSQVEGLGWRRLELLEKYYGTFAGVWRSRSREWSGLGVNEVLVESFAKVKRKDEEKFLSKVKRRRLGGVMAYFDEEYPQVLREIASPPLVLYYEGNLELLKEKGVGVVGTRGMSEYGKRMTEMFVEGLVKRGFVIVSGLARGVDGVAHRTCVEKKGETLAVLAHGLDMVYPKEHFDLMKRIVDKEGLLVSEHAPGVKPKRKYFVARNRIIAGLSETVLVCEAPRKSGTKITVGFAGEQGKNVYVVPGPVTQKSYWGSVEIIKDGGIPVYSVEDMLGETS